MYIMLFINKRMFNLMKRMLVAYNCVTVVLGTVFVTQAGIVENLMLPVDS